MRQLPATRRRLPATLLQVAAERTRRAGVVRRHASTAGGGASHGPTTSSASRGPSANSASHGPTTSNPGGARASGATTSNPGGARASGATTSNPGGASGGATTTNPAELEPVAQRPPVLAELERQPARPELRPDVPEHLQPETPLAAAVLLPPADGLAAALRRPARERPAQPMRAVVPPDGPSLRLPEWQPRLTATGWSPARTALAVTCTLPVATWTSITA